METYEPCSWCETPIVECCFPDFCCASCKHDVVTDEPEKTEVIKFTAEFNKVADAKEFAVAIRRTGWYCTNVVHKGRKVSFDRSCADKVALFEAASDYRETVGYWGSTPNRKAHLSWTNPFTGVAHRTPCPVAY